MRHLLNRILRLPGWGAFFVRGAILGNGDYILIVGAGCVVAGVWRASEAAGFIVLGLFLMLGGSALMKGGR